MLTVLILITAYLVISSIGIWIKDEATRSRQRWESRVYAAAERQDAARLHAYNLASIERVRRNTAAELVRIATDDGGDVIEGTAVEVHRS
jgi:hypothetical protein